MRSCRFPSSFLFLPFSYLTQKVDNLFIQTFMFYLLLFIKVETPFLIRQLSFYPIAFNFMHNSSFYYQHFSFVSFYKCATHTEIERQKLDRQILMAEVGENNIERWNKNPNRSWTGRSAYKRLKCERIILKAWQLNFEWTKSEAEIGKMCFISLQVISSTCRVHSGRGFSTTFYPF